jgi:hypothetical protein
MAAANALVGAMIVAISQGDDHKLLVDESLRYTLKGIELCPKNGDKMLLGYEGMPKNSKKLVSLGVFCINDEYVCLHPDIYDALEEKKAKRDRLIERLKCFSADREESINEQDLAGLL